MDKSPTWGGSFYGPGFLERRDDVILMEQEQARLDEEEARRKREEGIEVKVKRMHYAFARDIGPYDSYLFYKKIEVGELWHRLLEPRQLYRFHELQGRLTGKDYKGTRSDLQERIGREFARNLRS